MNLKSTFYKRLLFTTALILSPYAVAAMERELPSQDKHQASPSAQEDSYHPPKRARSCSELIPLIEAEDRSQDQLGKRKRELKEKAAQEQSAVKKSKVTANDADLSTVVVAIEQFNAEEQAQNYWNDRNFVQLFQLLADHPYLVNQPIHYTAGDGAPSQMPLLAALEKIEDNTALRTLMASIEGSDCNSDLALTLAPKEALLAAIVLKKNKAAQHILSQRPDLAYCVNKKGHTSMHLACLVGNQDIVLYLNKIAPDLLLKENTQTGEIPLDLLDFNNESMPLLNFFDQHHPDFLLRPIKLLNVRTLRANKIFTNGNLVGKVNMLSILVASYLKQKQSSEVIRILKNHPELLRDGFILDGFDAMWSGSNIIHVAAFQGMIDVIQYALQLDNSAVYQLSKSQTLCVDYASQGGHLRLLQLLLESYQGDLDLLSHHSKEGLTIFHFACFAPTTDVLDYLYQLKPSSITKPDHQGKNLLEYAVEQGKLDAVKWLLKTMAPSDQQLQALLENRLALIFVACFSNNPQMIAYLHSLAPALLNARTLKFGRSPLEYAVVKGCIESARWLLDNMEPAHHPRDLLHLACDSDDPQMLEFIYGRNPACLSIAEAYTQSPLKYALDQKKFKAADWILNRIMTSSSDLSRYIFAKDRTAALSVDQIMAHWRLSENQLAPYIGPFDKRIHFKRLPWRAVRACPLAPSAILPGVRGDQSTTAVTQSPNPLIAAYLNQHQFYLKKVSLSRDGNKRSTSIVNSDSVQEKTRTAIESIISQGLTSFMEAILTYYSNQYPEQITLRVGKTLVHLLEIIPSPQREAFIDAFATADKLGILLESYTLDDYLAGSPSAKSVSVINQMIGLLLKQEAHYLRSSNKVSTDHYHLRENFNAMTDIMVDLDCWAFAFTRSIFHFGYDIELLKYLFDKFPQPTLRAASKYIKPISRGQGVAYSSHFLTALAVLSQKDIHLLEEEKTPLTDVKEFTTIHFLSDVFPELLQPVDHKATPLAEFISKLKADKNGNSLLNSYGMNVVTLIKLFTAAPETLTPSIIKNLKGKAHKDSALSQLMVSLSKLKPLLPPSTWKETILNLQKVSPFLQQLYNEIYNNSVNNLANADQDPKAPSRVMLTPRERKADGNKEAIISWLIPEHLHDKFLSQLKEPGENSKADQSTIAPLTVTQLKGIDLDLLELCLNHLPVNRAWELTRIQELTRLMDRKRSPKSQEIGGDLVRLKQIYSERCSNLRDLAWQSFKDVLFSATLHHRLTQADPSDHPLSLDLIENLKVLWVELPIHERLDTASPEEFATKISAMLKREN